MRIRREQAFFSKDLIEKMKEGDLTQDIAKKCVDPAILLLLKKYGICI